MNAAFETELESELESELGFALESELGFLPESEAIYEWEHDGAYQAARQRFLRQLLSDPKQPRHVLGWIRQELRRLQRAAEARQRGLRGPGGDQRRLRGVPGTDVGHRLGLHNQHAPQNFRLEDPRFNRARPGISRRLGLFHRYREGENFLEAAAALEQELEIAAHDLSPGTHREAEEFFGNVWAKISGLAKSFWSRWSSQLAIAKRAFAEQRYGCFCGPGNVCTTARNSLDRCCQVHDADYGAVGVGAGAIDMWQLEGLKRTAPADQKLVRCSHTAINDGTPYGQAERAYQAAIVQIFGTRAAAGRAAMRLGL